ncbi:MAG: HD domain-containing protein [Spirochaetales bacterium]
MIEKTVALHLFGGFSVKRWNDLVRPMELNEMDRRSFAMMLAWFLGKLEEQDGREVDWDTIIFTGIFDLLRKIALSDIKETVHRRIRVEHPDEYHRLNQWVADSVAPMLAPYGLESRFREYFSRPVTALQLGLDPELGLDGQRNGRMPVERDQTPAERALQILEAARSYSTYREFQIIKGVNSHDPRIPTIENHLRKRMEPFLDLAGMRQLILELDLFRVISVTDRLRYQTRWSRTPRIPETAVLGHSLMVATFALLLTEQRAPCHARRYNNFFAGLFHDLPESVTRDIVAPTKTATPGLPEIVRKIEDETVAEEIYPHMTEETAREMRYFIEDEFTSKISTASGVSPVSSEKIDAQYNSDDYRPLDGGIVRVADEFAAFLEAQQSIQLGVASQILIEGATRLHTKYTKEATVSGVQTRKMFEQLPFSR